MHILTAIPRNFTSPLVLTIGTFDGVHKGHHKVLEVLRSEAQRLHAASGMISFSTHPKQVLDPFFCPQFICDPAYHKPLLLENEGIDWLFLLQFTKELSNTTALQFLEHLHSSLKFCKLILGHDARLGKKREGTPDLVGEIAKSLNFDLEYITPKEESNTPISSSRIRQLLQKGNLKAAEQLLGRPYSIYGIVKKGAQIGAQIGYQTANIPVPHLCLPPFGVYAVQVKIELSIFNGIVNLGVKPTFYTSSIPILEVHLLDQHLDLYEKKIEVTFLGFIRKERQFKTSQDLKNQIALDIQTVRKNYFSNKV